MVGVHQDDARAQRREAVSDTLTMLVMLAYLSARGESFWQVISPINSPGEIGTGAEVVMVWGGGIGVLGGEDSSGGETTTESCSNEPVTAMA